MNPPSQEPFEPSQEARLTALLLGELPDTEAEEIRRAMQSDPELARLHDRLKLTIPLLRSALEPPAAAGGGQMPKPRLTEDRRHKLLTQFKLLAPREFSPARRRLLHWSIPLMAAAVLVLVASLAALQFIWDVDLSRAKSKSMAGIARGLSSHEGFALEETRRVNERPTQENIERYAEKLRGQRATPGQDSKANVQFAGNALVRSPSPKVPEVQRAATAARSFVANADKGDAEPAASASVQKLYLPGGVTDDYGAFAQTRGSVSPLPPPAPVQPPASELGRVRELIEAKPEARARFGRAIVNGPAREKTVTGINDWAFDADRRETSPAVQAGDAIAGRLDSLGVNPSSAPNVTIDSFASKLPTVRTVEQQVADKAGKDELRGGGRFGDQAVNRPSGPPTGAVKLAEQEALGRVTGAAGQAGQATVGAAGKPAEARVPVLGDTARLGALFLNNADQNAAGASSRTRGEGAEGKFAGGFTFYADRQVPAGGTEGAAVAIGPFEAVSPSPATPPVEVARAAVALSQDVSVGTALRGESGGVEGASAAQGPAVGGLPGYDRPPRSAAPALQPEDRLASEGKAKTAEPQMRMRYGLLPKGAKALSTVSAAEEDVSTAIAPVDAATTKPEAAVERLADLDSNDAALPATEARLAKKAAIVRGSTAVDVAVVTNAEPPVVRRAAAAAEPQPEVATAQSAFSTFSLNVADVSFKLASASLENGAMPDPATVRSEEFINAFDYQDPEPAPGARVGFTWERARYPFAHNRDLIRLAVRTASRGREPGRPLNLVLLLDNSGSMERADRVRIIREALRILASQVQPQDQISVVAFARRARLWVDGLAGAQAGELVDRVGNLTPEGGTNLEDALNLAYRTALRHYAAQGNTRVVLLTDGAANLGDVDPESLRRKVESFRRQGIALDCFGIGWEGYNDDLLEALARNGDGRYGFVNTPEEAASEFAAQLTGALQVAASDVKVQVEFNPRRVKVYRQIGYAKHQLTKEQFRDNTVDAAELGAAESGNALYVLETIPEGEGDIGWVRVRYRLPGTDDYREQEWGMPYTGEASLLEKASPALRLAATASAFSEWLVTSPFAAEVTPDRLIESVSGVTGSFGPDPRPKRLEWMIRQAKSLGGR